MLGVTLLEDLITLLGVALLEVFRQFNRNATLLEVFIQFNRNATLLENLQIVVKPTLLRDLDHYYNG